MVIDTIITFVAFAAISYSGHIFWTKTDCFNSLRDFMKVLAATILFAFSMAGYVVYEQYGHCAISNAEIEQWMEE